MPRRQSEHEELRLERRLQARLAEKKARLDLQRPLAPGIVNRLHEDLRIRLTLEARKWGRRWYATPAALARYEEQARAEPRGRPSRHDRRGDTA